MAAEGISSRISRLNQLLLGKTPGRKVPLLDKETLLDAFMVLFNECNTDAMMEDKNISTYIKKFKPLISELEKLRLKKSDFEIRKTIGRGHFGEVHVVREKVTGNVYAMKVLKKTSTLAQDNVAFFEEERDIMAFANNPWITSLQYAFQDRESLYFVMDFHPGGDLLSLLAKYDDVFEEDVSRFYLAEMIMAIHAVHALGYVHRDVKPENVLIDRLGHVKLADFGSSARLSSAKTVVSKMPVGTPEYIAPEVLMSMDGGSSGGKYGIECDWWSLGVVAYEMMIGVTPFQADSVVVVYSNIMNFKNSLIFPDDEPLTDNAKSLIRSLLSDQETRIKYVELAKHSFFSGSDWTTLQNEVPPYVPTIQREDDTSNFDDFEPEPSSGPRLEDFMEKKKGFEGCDLPFIGFSFTKQLTLASLTETGDDISGHGTLTRGDSGTINRGKSIKRDSVKDNSSLQLANLKTEFEKEQKKNKELKLQIEEKMKNLSKLVQERDSLASDKMLFDTERQDLERRVNTEKTNREKLEKELSNVRKEMEENQSKGDSNQLKSKCEEQEQQIQQLEHDKSNLKRNLQDMEAQRNDNQKLLTETTARKTELQANLNKANKEHNSKVSELQQNMQQLTTDNESRIKHIQDKLNKETAALQEVNEKLMLMEKEKEDMQVKVVELKTFEELYKQQQGEKTSNEANEEIENLHKELSEKKAECKRLDKDVKKMATELEEANTKYDNLVEFGEDLKAQVERKMEKLQKELASSKKDKTKLTEDNEKIKAQLDENKTTIAQQEMTISTLQASCSSFEEQLSEFMNKKQPTEECETVIVEASGAQEERFHMTRQMSELSSEKFKLEAQLARIQLEADESQKEKEKLKETVEDIQRQLEEANESSQSTISKLNRDLTKANEESTKLQRELTNTKSRYEELEVKHSRLQDESEKVSSNTDKLRELESELRIAHVNVENLKSDKRGLEAKYQYAQDEVGKLRKSKQSVQDELSEKERQASNQEMTIHMLKQTCTMLEGQVEELEVMNDEYIDRESHWNMIKKQQYQAQERLELQYNETLALLEQQRLQRNRAEEKLREIEDNVSSSQYSRDRRVEEVEKLTAEHDEHVKELNASISTLRQKDGINQSTIKNLEKKLINSTDEKERLLLEVSRFQELSTQQSTSNFELTLKIDTLNEQLEETITERDSVTNQMERTAFSHAEEKIKLDATLAQQTKLIDYLQMKVMGDNKDFQSGKKKFNFGGKAKQQAESSVANQVVDVRKTRDLEKAIEKEKNNALQLHLQLQKARDEVTNLKNENSQLKTQLKNASTPTTPQPNRVTSHSNMLKTPSTNSVISNLSMNRSNESPPTSVADIYQMAENEVRGYEAKPFEIPTDDDSPHNMQATLNMRSGKCPVCLNCVAFATKVVRCAECGLICHVSCTQSLLNTCGMAVPGMNGQANHRSSLLAEDGSMSGDEDGAFKLPKIEGWLKYPRKNGSKQNWERKWVVLQDMKLSIYENENTIEFDPFDEIGDLNINEGELNIHPSIPASELIWSNSSDIQYVFSIELLPYTLGWPRRTLYFLAPTFADKQKWVASLELIGEEVKKSTQRNGHGMADNVILTLPVAADEKPLDLNCAALLNDTGAILGCDDGLYVVSFKPGSQHNKPVHIIGLGSVYQLQIVRDLGIALLIVGKERELCYIDVYDLESRLKQLQTGANLSAITSQQIEKVKACHLFIVQKLDNDYYACAATTRKISILKYLPNTQNFSLKKEVETSEPATCLLLTPNNALYGTSKFFAVDLKNYQKRELLERSDTSLAFAVFGSSQTQSFPVAVFNIGEGRTRDEYLLCYNQFGIFVDWQGRRSRKEDLKWSRLPLAFEYRAPHLYISHFSSIEICEIPGDAKSEISNIHRRFVDVPDPRFVGTGLQSRIVLFSSTQKTKLELISYQATVSLNPLSRHSSTASAMSLASTMSSSSGFDSVPGTIREHSIMSDDIIQRTSSNVSICSDEETSNAIGSHKDTKPHRSNNPKDRIRNQEKDRTKISFSFLKKKDRKSQNFDG